MPTHARDNAFTLRLTLLMTLAVALFLAGNNAVGLFDRDEPWYAEISREMVRSGDWVVPRFEGVTFLGKPVFAFWCSAASIARFGDTAFAARLPSALAMLATMLVVALALAKFVGRRRAIWSSLILGTSVLAIALAKMCLTDSILLLWITLAQIALYAIYRGRGGTMAVLGLWVAVGLAVLTKGPVVIGILGSTALALLLLDVGANWRSPAAWRTASAWWPRTHPWLGIFIAAAVVGPWAMLIHHRAPGFLMASWLANMYGPITHASLEGHAGPPGYYLLLIWPMFLPWSLLLPLALAKGWSNRRLAPVRFALAGVIGPWITMELVKQKLPHYLLPLFPCLAFLTADALVRCIRGQYPDLIRPRSRVGLIAWAIIVALSGFIPFLAAMKPIRAPDLPTAAIIVLGLATTAYAVIVVTLMRRRRVAAAACSMGVGMMIGTALLFTCVLPQLQFMRLSPRCAALLLARGDGNAVALIERRDGHHELGYKEPSLAYYLGGKLNTQDAGLLKEPQARWPAWLVLTADVWQDVPDGAKARLDRVATFRGLNYGGGGRMVELIVVHNLDAQAEQIPQVELPTVDLLR